MLDNAETSTWVKAIAAALAGLSMRVAWQLFGAVAELPPDDLALRRQWARRRRWLLISEFSALPAFATAWMQAAIQWSIPVPVLILGSMATGALGVGFFLDALRRLALLRLGIGETKG